MRKLFVGLVTLCLCVSVFAQTASIRGHVARRGVVEMSLAHVIYVNQSSGARFETTADAHGNYSFSDLPLAVSRETPRASNFLSLATNNGGAVHELFFANSTPLNEAILYNLLGQRVAAIPLTREKVSDLWISHGVWDGANVADGIYFAAVKIASNLHTLRVLHFRSGNSGIQGLTQNIKTLLAANITHGNRRTLDDTDYRVTITPSDFGTRFGERTFTRRLADGDNGSVIDTVFSAIPQRILFVGNSHTYYNGGVEVHVRNFAHSADSTLPLYSTSVTFGGYTLEDHWNNGAARAAIDTGRFDMVILQEQSGRPVENPPLMFQYATLFDSVIRRSGAETGFYMTWRWLENPFMIDTIAQSYNFIGAQLGALVAPCGRAWQLCNERDPLLNLYVSDGNHASVFGTYLTVCVFYAAIFQHSPVGVAYVNDPSITPDIRDFLQHTAWDAVQQYGPRWE